jgi:integrase/recombinase XerD
MLIDLIERYLSLRQTLGFTLRDPSRHLRAFAQFAADTGDTHIRAATAVAWASAASSPSVRHVRLRNIIHLARFLHAEDPRHEVPSNPRSGHPRSGPSRTSTRPRRSRGWSRRPSACATPIRSGVRCMRL